MSNEEIAREIFERKIGRPVFYKTVNEVIRYGPNGAELRHKPVVRIHSVEAKSKKWAYSELIGPTDWQPIELGHVHLYQKEDSVYMALPMNIFGSGYTDVRVKYDAGLVNVPVDILNAVKQIADLLNNGEIDRYNCILPSAVTDVIEKYRTGGAY